MIGICQRTCRKQFLNSSMKASGCSKAAKWPPLSNSFQWTSLVNRFSAHRREPRKTSLGKTLHPTGMPMGSKLNLLKLSQYRRADEAVELLENPGSLPAWRVHKAVTHGLGTGALLLRIPGIPVLVVLETLEG